MPNFSQPTKHNALAHPVFNFCPDDYIWGEIVLWQCLALKNNHWFQLLAVGSTGKYASNRSFFVVCCDYGNTLLSNLAHCPVGQINTRWLYPCWWFGCHYTVLHQFLSWRIAKMSTSFFFLQSIGSFWPTMIQLRTDSSFCFIKRWYQLGLPLKLGVPVLNVICFA